MAAPARTRPHFRTPQARKRVDMGLLALFVVGHIAALATIAVSPDVFSDVLAREDGSIENLTAFLLLAGSVFLVVRARQLWRHSGWRAVLCLLYGLLFLFAAGEEISWGQRIFDWQSSDFFRTYNHQAETNLHNLVVGDRHLATSVFGSWLTAILLLYLVVLPLLWPRAAWVRFLSAALAVPVPRLLPAVLILVASGVMGLIDIYRQFELYEFAFSIVALMVFQNPRNLALFHGGTPGAADRTAAV